MSDPIQIHHLIKRGNIIAIRTLLDEGLDPNTADKAGFERILMQAASEGNTALGELLISRGANVNWANKHGQTAFTFALLSARVGFIKLLLAHGGMQDANLTTNWLERTALSPKQARDSFEVDQHTP